MGMWVPMPEGQTGPTVKAGPAATRKVQIQKGEEEDWAANETEAIRQICEEAGWTVIVNKKGQAKAKAKVEGQKPPFGRQGASS